MGKKRKKKEHIKNATITCKLQFNATLGLQVKISPTPKKFQRIRRETAAGRPWSAAAFTSFFALTVSTGPPSPAINITPRLY